MIAKEVADLVEPVLDQMGFELLDVEYLSYQGRWVLRLYIDQEGGITVDDCARVSRELAGLDTQRAEEEFLQFAQSSEANDEFDALIGLATQEDDAAPDERTRIPEE